MRRTDRQADMTIGWLTRSCTLGLAGCAVLLFGCCLAGIGCSEDSAEQGGKGNTLSSHELLWSYEAPLFWGHWGKGEDHLCLANAQANTLDILDRRTGLLLRSVEMPFSEVHGGGNKPILVQSSTAHIFASKYSDDCKTVNMATGRIAIRKAPLGTIKRSRANSVLVSGGKLSYGNAAAAVRWEVPFNKEGSSILSSTSPVVASRNIYVFTHVYKGKTRPGDLLPGGYVTGKPVGFSLKTYGKRTGKSLWLLPVERRLYFCAETDSAVLVNCSELHTFRAHAVNTGKKLWKRELPGARFSTCDGGVALFLEPKGVRAIDVLTGRTVGRLAFRHDISALPFDHARAHLTTPALYWTDAFVVCEEAKGKDGKPIVRLRCYGKRRQGPGKAQPGGSSGQRP